MERSTSCVRACLRELRRRLGSGVVLEVRADWAFFSDEIVTLLGEEGVEFALSVPFDRFAELKQLVDRRKRWQRINGQYSFTGRIPAGDDRGLKIDLLNVLSKNTQCDE